MEQVNPVVHEHVIYWVRHGETDGNRDKIHKDPMESHLTDIGKHQSKLAGEKLANVQFDRAYSSNLPRAIDTAKIILQHSKNSSSIPLIIDENLREREHGTHGISYDELRAKRGVGLDKDHPLWPYVNFYNEGTEDILKILERAEKFFMDLMRDLSKCVKGQTVLVVSHGYFTSLWMTHLGLPNERFILKNYTDSLTVTLQNGGYHKFKLSLKSSETNCLQWEFLEVDQFDHLLELIKPKAAK